MKSNEFITESIKGQGTTALRKVLADFGFQAHGNIYSDKRRNGRRVKVVPAMKNPKQPPKQGGWYRSVVTIPKKMMPSQQEVEASVARHFGSMNVVSVVVHLADKSRFNDHNYIAVSYTE